jgi:Tfp pilus assembly pilus retraction ATPase PilT
MKNNIKETLIDNTVKNSMGIYIKPNSELIICRGIPGSGKSTKAKSLLKQRNTLQWENVCFLRL